VSHPERGTKRICPETGRKFYDLNRDPIISPYTGKSYPVSFFESNETEIEEIEEKEVELEAEEVEEADSDVEIVTLEDADEEASGGSEDVPDIDGDSDDVDIDDDVDIGDDDDDTFLETDDDDDDDMTGIISVGEDDEET
jgi:uncharacterized protein (TIGR02300 family)